MIEDFEVKKEVFEHLPQGSIHFELSLGGKSYMGQYRNGYVNWYHPQPDPGKHGMSIDEVEYQVQKIIVKRYENENMIQ